MNLDAAHTSTSGRAAAATVSLRGGRLCLDFVNTIDPRMGPRRHDLLDSYTALIAWGEHAGAISEHAARALRAEERSRPDEATAVLEAGVALREALHRLFSTLVGGRTIEGADLASLHRALVAALIHQRVVAHNGGFEWDWEPDSAGLDRILWPVTRSAAELLTSGDRARVRACPGEHRGWLFLDTTKNRGRRCCSMEGCGSQEESRRYYQRHRPRTQQVDAGPADGVG